MARSRAHDFEDKRKRILDAAASVFASTSMDKASMSVIARKAHISKALLYHYYASKDELIYGIVNNQLLELLTALKQADVPNLDPDVRLRNLIQAVVAQYENADDLHRVRITYMNSLPDEMIERLGDTERAIVGVFARTLKELNPTLVESKNHLMPVTMTLFGSFNWIHTWFRDDGPMSRDEYADLITSLFLNGIRSLNA